MQFLNYTKYVKRWFSVLMPKIVPFLYGNGGNIIMVQVENEYGHNDLGNCDREYKLWLRDLILYYVGEQAQLYTTDECGLSYLKCGHIPNVLSTVDFAALVNVTECLDFLRQVQKKGPLVNSEFYNGGVGFWDNPRPARYTKDIIRVLNYFLATNVSFNFFMFHGGTNFGFTTGANTVGTTFNKTGYQPQLTSYDFTAPLNEAGDPTEKYYAIKQTLKKANFPTASTPKISPKGNYGTVNLLPVVSLFDNAARRLESILNDVPLCFEDMDINQGLVLYETNLPMITGLTKLPLVIKSLSDRAIIFLNNVKLGTLSRSYDNTTMELSVNGSNQKLSILVENQGRINDKKFLEDRKGILSNVTLGTYVLGPWVMTGYPLNETSWLETQNIQPNVKPPA
ncbi:beta-galactosidase-like, partial [Melanaphis sacchari]|uniref:beta-galactosidase-like n=1 Tax=Melanaphis sacchari TaxID=742174 RepID=UPI000DC13149